MALESIFIVRNVLKATTSTAEARKAAVDHIACTTISHKIHNNLLANLHVIVEKFEGIFK